LVDTSLTEHSELKLVYIRFQVLKTLLFIIILFILNILYSISGIEDMESSLITPPEELDLSVLRVDKNFGYSSENIESKK